MEDYTAIVTFILMVNISLADIKMCVYPFLCIHTVQGYRVKFRGCAQCTAFHKQECEAFHKTQTQYMWYYGSKSQQLNLELYQIKERDRLEERSLQDFGVNCEALDPYAHTGADMLWECKFIRFQRGSINSSSWQRISLVWHSPVSVCSVSAPGHRTSHTNTILVCENTLT